MTSLFLFVLLTQNGAGDITASFVNTLTLDQCQQKALVIEGIFNSAKIPILEKHCIKSELQFSTFGHAESSRQKRHFYQIQFNGDHSKIKPIDHWKSCKKEPSAGIYCASSLQSIISLEE